MLLGVLLAISVGLNVLIFMGAFRLYDENEKLQEKDKRLIDMLCETIKDKNKMSHKLEEHDEIFNKLAEDPMCLAKALKAWEDVVNRLIDDGEYDLADKICDEINLEYSVSNNHYEAISEKITISLFSDESEQRKFLYEYLNETYGTNLNGSDIRTDVIFTILHELGHYVDYSHKKRLSTRLYDLYLESNLEEKQALDKIKDGPESWRAYRKVYDEYQADKFAIEMMLKHFPELCGIKNMAL